MCEFYDRIEEAKKGFEYFPSEWNESIENREKFRDYVRLSFKDTNMEEIPLAKDVGKFYHGFTRASQKFCLEKKIENMFFYQKDGKIKYLQSEVYDSNKDQIRTLFKDEFNIVRFYGERYGEFFLEGIEKRLPFEYGADLKLSVSQADKDYFIIKFLKNQKEIFGIFLLEEDFQNWDLVEGIIAHPKLFSDLSLVESYFDKRSFFGKKNNVDVVIEFNKEFDLWKNLKN